MEFSIIIPTFDRVASLDRLLRSISESFFRFSFDVEILIANNARDEVIGRQIEAVIVKYADATAGKVRGVRERLPGKCRAQNRAIAEAQGAILVFFDDDVQVDANWLPVTAKFFNDKPEFDVMQGPILMPPQMCNDKEFLRLHERFRTINFLQYRKPLTEINTLTGANIAMRRTVIDRIGGFNEALGPGCSGISEDVEFAQRVTNSGMRIGYEPDARVIHEVDPSRLCEEFFRQRHEQQGRSRLIYKKQSMGSILGNLLRSVWALAWFSMVGNTRKKYRAKGRYFHYRAMVAEKLKNRQRPVAG